MSIILETILGIIFIIAFVAVLAWFLFREQFERVAKYMKLWAEQDAKREAREARLREQSKARKEEADMREASARERAEAEVEELESGS